ncbi:hypothetical protein [uncultured Meiothermus sp.]|jgi:hypothetical protein|uniref:hypothetical protein n=1 Tax=uncultured Meiothermus sp. TaxID=157471 RepID=UPI00260C5683|nr:hypothetical protein [uncultured Meiothermus sp.]
MVTLHKINALREGRVLECVGQDSGDNFRMLIMHTSPSHYEALGKVTLSNASITYQSSGPMAADLLLQWLDTLFDRWPRAKTLPWAVHDLDHKTRQFVHEVREAARVA